MKVGANAELVKVGANAAAVDAAAAAETVAADVESRFSAVVVNLVTVVNFEFD